MKRILINLTVMAMALYGAAAWAECTSPEQFRRDASEHLQAGGATMFEFDGDRAAVVLAYINAQAPLSDYKGDKVMAIALAEMPIGYLVLFENGCLAHIVRVPADMLSIAIKGTM